MEVHVKTGAFLNSEPWRRLRPQQQAWVVEFIASRDAFSATRRAYPKATEKSLVPMTYEIQRSQRVKDAIKFWNETTNRIVMIEIITAELAASEPGSAAAANFSNQLQQLLLESLPTEIARA
jgi:hypothetical protein